MARERITGAGVPAQGWPTGPGVGIMADDLSLDVAEVQVLVSFPADLPGSSGTIGCS